MQLLCLQKRKKGRERRGEREENQSEGKAIVAGRTSALTLFTFVYLCRYMRTFMLQERAGAQVKIYKVRHVFGRMGWGKG